MDDRMKQFSFTLVLFSFARPGPAPAAIFQAFIPKLVHYLQEVLFSVWRRRAFGVRLLIKSDFAASWEKW